MIRHRRIRISLYDYLKGELPPAEAAALEKHLSGCTPCRKEAEQLKGLLRLTHQAFGTPPSEERTAEFWEAFAARVEGELQESHGKIPRPQESVLDLIGSFLILHGRPVAAAGGFVALLVLGVLLWRGSEPPVVQEASHPGIESVSSTALEDAELLKSDEQVSRYFRKSRILLVGLANMPTDEGGPPDLGTEQKMSRQLIYEARSLKERPIDIRSAQLIREMEPILVELASIKPGREKRDVDLIRGGIRKENLLFKIRMEEGRYSGLPVMAAKHTYSKEP